MTTLSRTVEGLRARGHEVHVIHPGLFRTVPCPTYPEIRLAILPGRKIKHMLDAFMPGAIHLPTEGPIGIAARHYAIRRKLPFTTAYTTRWPEYVQMRIGVPVGLTYRLLRWFHGRGARMMVSTPSLKAELETRGFGPIVFWSRGVDTELFRPRLKNALAGPRPILVYMGRVSVEKNIQAFLELHGGGQKVVIGDGPALEGLKKIYPHVHFLGRKTGEDLARLLAAADVFVFPSLTDTFGIVLIEAMACGVPVAAFPVTGPKDVVLHGETGWLDEGLDKAVEKALEMDPERCREHACQYSWARSIEQFEQNLALR